MYHSCTLPASFVLTHPSARSMTAELVVAGITFVLSPCEKWGDTWKKKKKTQLNTIEKIVDLSSFPAV